MIKGFRDFILRGNVIDLAVAVVIGGAFAALVGVFADSVIAPFINALGGADAVGLGFTIRSGNEATFVDLGAVITAVITFLITAAVVYFVFVVPMNAYNERKAAKTEPEPEEEPEISDEAALLTEIRDLLARREQQ